jgi:hypothetical protein
LNAARVDFEVIEVFSLIGTSNESQVRICVNDLWSRFAPVSLGQRSVMSITIKLDLPDSVAAEAQAKGFLDPRKLTEMVEREVELDKPMQDFRQMVEQMRAYPDEPMTKDEIQSVVNEVRVERRARRESSR